MKVERECVTDRPFEMAGRPGFELSRLAQRLTRFRFVDLFPCRFLIGADRCIHGDPSQDTAVIVGAIRLAERSLPPRLALAIRARSASNSALVTVGRSTWSDVLIPDARVSRRHALFRLGVSRVFLRDVGSTNGTFIEGRRVSEVGGGVPVPEGATVQFASLQLRLVEPEAAWDWLRA